MTNLLLGIAGILIILTLGIVLSFKKKDYKDNTRKKN
jgi:LPXTG-motif cell wall-anchored protein